MRIRSTTTSCIALLTACDGSDDRLMTPTDTGTDTDAATDISTTPGDTAVDALIFDAAKDIASEDIVDATEPACRTPALTHSRMSSPCLTPSIRGAIESKAGRVGLAIRRLQSTRIVLIVEAKYPGFGREVERQAPLLVEPTPEPLMRVLLIEGDLVGHDRTAIRARSRATLLTTMLVMALFSSVR